MKFRLIVTLLILTLPLLAGAEIETFHYKGDLEMLALSGNECIDKERPGSHIPIDMALKVERSWKGERFEGYYSGPDIQIGYFSGANPGTLLLYYPEEGNSVNQGHVLSLHINNNSIVAEIHEKHLAPTENGCNFDNARLILRNVGTDEKPEAAYKHLEKQFTSEAEYLLGYRMLYEGKITESLPHLEAAVRLREEFEGFKTQDMVYPALFLSMADCVTGRLDEGFKLQKRVFNIPMEVNKRHELQHTVLINLFSDQAQRLGKDGNWDQATSLIEWAIAKYPNLTEFQPLMAEQLIEQGRLYEACSRLEKIIKEHPTDANLGNALAWCLVQQGNELFDEDDPSTSLKLFHHALDLNPVSRETWNSILDAYTDIGKPEEVNIILQKKAKTIIRIYGKKEYAKLQAHIFSEEARHVTSGIDYAQQEELFRKAVELDPDNPGYVTLLARTLHRNGRFRDSLNLLEKQRGLCKDDNCQKIITESMQKESLLERLVKKLN